MSKKQVILIVLDGWGYREEKEYNAIVEAKTPFFDYLWHEYTHSLLEASGIAVGLPEGQMGNSEVGHTTIGAGKVIYTDLTKISKEANENQFEHNRAFQELFDHIKKYDSVLHVHGLIGNGGVHSHSNHLFAFIKAAKSAGINKVAIHVFTDGRDTPPQSAHKFLAELEEAIGEIGIGFIATATGRFYAMDRDNNWERLKLLEDAIFEGKGTPCKKMRPSKLLEELHKKGEVDEHIKPIIFLDENGQSSQIQKNDGVFFFNFRKDRARMLTQRLIEKREELNLCIVTMTQYDKNFDCLIAFYPDKIETTLSKEISKNGLRQAHIAETEKYAHATYYLNGGEQEPYTGEDDYLIESRKDISTHDQAPEMKASEITQKTKEAIDNEYDFIFVNYANPDMVGHTGNRNALIKSIEILDSELEKLVSHAQEKGAEIIITADHGNAEIYFDNSSNQNHTAHTTNLVPFIYIGSKSGKAHGGTLADLAPTVLKLLDLEIAKTMTGQNLIK